MTNTPRPTAWTFRGFIDAALWVGLAGAFGLCALTLTAFAADTHWLAELTSHFRVHYAAGLILCVIIYAMARRFRLAALFGVFAVVNLAMIAPRFFPRASPPASAPTITLLLSNVLTSNRDHGALLELIAHEQPDVIVLLEVNRKWMDALGPLAESHPHSHRMARADNFGIALFSRIPLSNAETIYLADSDVPTIRAHVSIGGQPIVLFATHPLPPGNADNTRERDRQLADLASHTAASSLPTIVIGDLNCTPWSPVFRRLLADGHLADTGRGVRPTWPVQPRWLRIPLDHCLTSPSLRTVDHRVGPPIGSDHFPIIVRLGLASADR